MVKQLKRAKIISPTISVAISNRMSRESVRPLFPVWNWKTVVSNSSTVFLFC
nr:MAG TPA: bacteriocin [Bacteriophage sp.]